MSLLISGVITPRLGQLTYSTTSILLYSLTCNRISQRVVVKNTFIIDGVCTVTMQCLLLCFVKLDD